MSKRERMHTRALATDDDAAYLRAVAAVIADVQLYGDDVAYLLGSEAAERLERIAGGFKPNVAELRATIADVAGIPVEILDARITGVTEIYPPIAGGGSGLVVALLAIGVDGRAYAVWFDRATRRIVCEPHEAAD